MNRRNRRFPSAMDIFNRTLAEDAHCTVGQVYGGGSPNMVWIVDYLMKNEHIWARAGFTFENFNILSVVSKPWTRAGPLTLNNESFTTYNRHEPEVRSNDVVVDILNDDERDWYGGEITVAYMAGATHDLPAIRVAWYTNEDVFWELLEKHVGKLKEIFGRVLEDGLTPVVQDERCGLCIGEMADCVFEMGRRPTWDAVCWLVELADVFGRMIIWENFCPEVQVRDWAMRMRSATGRLLVGTTGQFFRRPAHTVWVPPADASEDGQGDDDDGSDDAEGHWNLESDKEQVTSQDQDVGPPPAGPVDSDGTETEEEE